MTDILVYGENADESRKVLGELTRVENITFSFVSEVEGLESQLKHRRFDLLILVVGNRFSDGLANVISKNRNLSTLRDTDLLSIHASAPETSVQKALMCGVRTLLLEPLEDGVISARVRRRILGSDLPEAPPASEIQPLPRVPCEIEAYGRIGKISWEPSVTIHVEADLIIPPGAPIDLKCRLAEDLDRFPLDVRSEGSSKRDLYYRYAACYELRSPDGEDFERALRGWLKVHAKSFVIPKTKVLWVTDEVLGDKESFLEKWIFSLYVRDDARLSDDYLERLNPKIILLEEFTASGAKVVESYAARRDVLVLTIREGPGADRWGRIQAGTSDDFRKEFSAAVTPQVRKRVGEAIHRAVYVSRGSPYSRCAFSFRGNVTAAGEQYLEVESRFDAERGTTLHLVLPGGARLYARVVGSRPGEASYRWLLILEGIPVSDRPAASLRETIERSQDRAVRPAATEPRAPQLLAQRLAIPGKPLLIAALAIVLTLLAHLVVPAAKIPPIHPMQMSEFFRAVREAFH